MSTGIPYVDETWNLGCGCTKIAPGCLHCWAEELHTMRHKAFLAGKHVPPQYAKPFSEVQFLPKRLDQPLHWRKPRDIFVCSMSDLFHPKVSDRIIRAAFETMWAADQHRYFIFTKRVERANHFLEQYDPLTENIWLMLSISTQKEADEKIPILRQTNIAHRGLSIEPMLEAIDLRYTLSLSHRALGKACLDWVIVGCESGAKRRPCSIEAIRGVVRQCKEADVSVWVKQISLENRVVKDIDQFPSDLQIQEKPCPAN